MNADGDEKALYLFFPPLCSTFVILIQTIYITKRPGELQYISLALWVCVCWCLFYIYSVLGYWSAKFPFVILILEEESYFWISVGFWLCSIPEVYWQEGNSWATWHKRLAKPQMTWARWPLGEKNQWWSLDKWNCFMNALLPVFDF